MVESRKVDGVVRLLGDKSLAHRAMLFCTLAKGTSTIENFPQTGVSSSMLDCLKALGVQIKIDSNKLVVVGNGFEKFHNCNAICNCGNSATTMRLLIGALVGTKTDATIIGTSSLSSRPIRVDQIINLLWNGSVDSKNGYLPAKTKSNRISSLESSQHIDIEYPSAQVKSAIILAILGNSKARITLDQKIKTRNHSENMLNSMGAKIETRENEIAVYPLEDDLRSINGILPGDISSAAFILSLAAIVPNSHVVIDDVLLNQSRLGFVSALKQAGCYVDVEVLEKRFGEDVGRIELMSPSRLKPMIVCDQQQVADMIDEFPAMSIVMSMADGISKVRNANELRYKESDRIHSIVDALTSIGIECKEYQDGFDIVGNSNLTSYSTVKTNNDHRIAMAFYILGLVVGCKIDDEDIINQSFTDFKKTIQELLK